MLCRVVTRFRARRETAPGGATAPEATPKATGPEVVAPTAPETEVEAEGRSATPEPAGAREEPPVVPAEDVMEGYSDHVSVLNSSSFCLAFLSGARQRS